jgi:uncharacterized protein (DUF2141 family)
MTSYINVKNKQGLYKLATLIKQAGFDDVKVTIKPKSITLTQGNDKDLSAGLADLKAGRYASFKNVGDAADFLSNRTQKVKRKVTSRK